MSEQSAGAAPGGEAPGGGEEQQPGLGMYDLSSAPEELRPYLAEELKKYDGNVTKKFQEHADFRKRFEPYQEIDFGDVPADELNELLQFRQILSDPDQFQEWLGAVNEQFGGGEATTPEEWLAIGEQNGWIDGDGNFDAEGGPEEPPAWAQDLIERIDKLDGGFSEFKGKTEGEQAANKQAEAFRSRIEELEIPDEDRSNVIQQAKLFLEGEDPIGEAWNHLQQLRGTAEGDRIEERLNRNGETEGALTNGQPNSPDDHLSFDDPGLKQAALARMRQGT